MVIGEQCKNVAEKNALEYVKGYTCMKDLSNHEEMGKRKRWYASNYSTIQRQSVRSSHLKSPSQKMRRFNYGPMVRLGKMPRYPT
jgi:2-keto-4-pentenoate hydratase/2-oxohepta-3-ene-1,7-dioic acid hydratase in catechol pathway